MLSEHNFKLSPNFGDGIRKHERFPAGRRYDLGKQQSPLWHYYFRSRSQRLDLVDGVCDRLDWPRIEYFTRHSISARGQSWKSSCLYVLVFILYSNQVVSLSLFVSHGLIIIRFLQSLLAHGSSVYFRLILISSYYPSNRPQYNSHSNNLATSACVLHQQTHAQSRADREGLKCGRGELHRG
jgi:hypothetical protein